MTTQIRRGFTLIVLLVVVLIIAILAAVAVPQYNKAVEKSRAAQGIALVRALGQAAAAYYLANGTRPTNLDQLDVSLSDEQKAEFECSSIGSTCDTKEWGVALYGGATNGVKGVVAWRTSGRYKGGGFAMYYDKGTSVYKTNTLYCIERAAGSNMVEQQGIYCEKLMKATHLGNENNSYHYTMPE